MNQISEPAVQPRRNLLTALWVWAVGLWGSSNLLAATTCAQNPSPAPQSCEDTLKQYAFTILVGRLCLDSTFRAEFFKSKAWDKAVEDLLKKEPRMLTKDDMVGADKWVDKMLKAHKSPDNPIQDACYSVDSAISTALKTSVPCIPWPC